MTRTLARRLLLVAATSFFVSTFPNPALAQTASFTAQTFAAGANPQVVAVGDFNGDGKLDLAVVNAGSTTVSVLLGNGDGTFQPALTFDAGGSNPTYVAAADFNGDGKLDLAVTIYGCFFYNSCPVVSNAVAVLLGNGDGTFQAPRIFLAGSGPNSVAVGDFNGDGKLDLAVADFGPSTQRATTVSVLLGNGDGTFLPPLIFDAGPSPAFAVAGDFNGDGKLDLAVANYDAATVSVLLGNGNGTFQAARSFGVGSGPWAVAVGDFNGDGVQDLAVANYISTTVSVLLGNGDGTFQAALTFGVDHGPTSVAVGDFNGDGKLDLAVANYLSTTVSVLLGNGDGTFQAAQNFGAGSGPAFVAVDDFNGDGKLDLAVPDYDSTTVSVLINTTASQAVTLLSLALKPTTVTGGSSSTGTVTLSGPAPSGGALVSLSGNNTSVATVPASVTVPAGGTTATFTVSTSPVSASTSVTISASYGGVTRTASLTVKRPKALSLTLNPTSVTGGNPSTGTVTLNGKAPSDGVVFSLSSSDAAATVPSSVTVPAGATSATFPVSTSPVPASTPVTISASEGGVTRTASLTVLPPILSSLTLTPTSVTGGLESSTGTVTLNGPAPAGGAPVALSSSNTSAATVPSSVTVPAGATSATFPVNTSVVVFSTTVTISASYNGTTQGASLTVRSTVPGL